MNRNVKTMLRTFSTFLFLILFTSLCSAGERTSLTISESSPCPIAIPEFKNLDGRYSGSDVSKQIAEVIAQDLTFSGIFRVLDPAGYLEDPQKSGITENDIDFQSWSVIGAQALVKGGVRQRGTDLVVEARLFDVATGSFLTGRRYIGSRQTLRKIAHKFSDQVYLAMTGEPGIFETQIAFVKQQGRFKEIYTMDYDGYNERRFSYHGTVTLSPRWSPDGKQIAFTSYKGGRSSITVKDFITRKEFIVSPYHSLNVSPDWSPDGRELAVTLSKDGNPEIYAMDLQGRVVKRLTHDAGIDVSPSWSPDGQKIVFCSSRSGSPQIYTMDRYGGNVTRLTYEGSYNSEPDWSPKGDRIVYSSLRNGGYQICTIKPDRTENIQLTWEGSNESPKWSVDGRHIVFLSNRVGGKQLFAMLANGTHVKQLTRGGRNISPSWSPNIP